MVLKVLCVSVYVKTSAAGLYSTNLIRLISMELIREVLHDLNREVIKVIVRLLCNSS